MKNALRSKTVWGILAAAAGHFGISAEIVANPETAATADLVLSLVGYALALYGRWKAGGISLLPTKDVPAAP